jgi:hypothetical protein
MNWFHDYEEKLSDVFQDCEQIISRFPDPLNSQGLAYLHHFNVFESESHKNYICYLLPYWMQESCRLTDNECRQMSRGNVYLMLYFFIQDDLMDKPTASPSMLPLANLLYIEFLNIYRSLFPGQSSFWNFFNKYITEWADSVSNELTEDYFLENKVKVAHKASPLKLSSTAALLLSDQEDYVTNLEEILDYVLLSLQMLDDYEDWEADLKEGSYNCLLSLTGRQLQKAAGTVTPEEVRAFIFTGGGLKHYLHIALTHNIKLREFRPVLPYLLSFHEGMTDNLQKLYASIEAEKKILQGGGLAYWLSKNMN